MYAIKKDLMSFTTMDKPGFTCMLKLFNHCYEQPSRKYISKTVVPDLYNITREIMKLELKKAFFFNLWSSDTLHPCIWDMKSFCLQTTYLRNDHTGDTLAEVLDDACGGMEIEHRAASLH